MTRSHDITEEIAAVANREGWPLWRSRLAVLYQRGICRTCSAPREGPREFCENHGPERKSRRGRVRNWPT